MGRLLKISDFNEFVRVKDIKPDEVHNSVLDTVKTLDERTELESAFLHALADPNHTAHGPAELFDIFTHRVTVGSKAGMAAFILKGRSFPTVRPSDVSHQIFRLRKANGLSFAVFAAVGNILDDVKDQFIITAQDLELDYAIFDRNDIARLMIAYGFLCPRDGRRLDSGRCSCGYRPNYSDLNILQQEALRCLTDDHRHSRPAGLIVMPTGSGKTRVAVQDIRRLGVAKVLYTAHSHEILDSATPEFEVAFGADNFRRVQKIDRLDSSCHVQLATIQLLSRHLEAVAALSPDYLVIDEFHHAAAPSYRRVIDAANPKFLLGLTATPFRSDWQDILDLCNRNLVVNFDLRPGIDSGILAPYHYYGCFDDIDYSRILPKNGRYGARDLERTLVVPERDQAIAAKWFEFAYDKATLAFCCSKHHAERVAKAFENAGVGAAVYTEKTNYSQRRSLLGKLFSGSIKVLCTVDVLNEGVDIPFIECLMFLRPTESKRIFFQQLGRGLRRYPGKFAVKVIDFIGNFHNAYKIMQYQGLSDQNTDEDEYCGNIRTVKELLTLPLGCSVEFDDRVMDIFEQQLRVNGQITRYNVERILIYYYKRLCHSMCKRCTRRDVDMYQTLYAELYVDVFGSWKIFYDLMKAEPDLAQFDNTSDDD